MQPARGNKKKNPEQAEDYWDRLSRQFQTCTYDHSGAYRETTAGRSAELHRMAADINYAEETLQSQKYQQLRKTGYFNPRPSDRLLRASRFFEGRIP